MSFPISQARKPWSEQRKLGKRRWVSRYVLFQFVLVSCLQILIRPIFNLLLNHHPLLTFTDWLPFSVIWGLISWGLGTGRWHDNEYDYNQRQSPSA